MFEDLRGKLEERSQRADQKFVEEAAAKPGYIRPAGKVAVGAANLSKHGVMLATQKYAKRPGVYCKRCQKEVTAIKRRSFWSNAVFQWIFFLPTLGGSLVFLWWHSWRCSECGGKKLDRKTLDEAKPHPTQRGKTVAEVRAERSDS